MLYNFFRIGKWDHSMFFDFQHTQHETLFVVALIMCGIVACVVSGVPLFQNRMHFINQLFQKVMLRRRTKNIFSKNEEHIKNAYIYNLFSNPAVKTCCLIQAFKHHRHSLKTTFQCPLDSNLFPAFFVRIS